MSETALFTQALRAAVPEQPTRELTATLVPRLASAARTATLEAETRAVRDPAALPMRRSRRALVAKIAIAVAAIPLLLAGLAFAGMTVPAPARDAFDSVGITLPNQSSDQPRMPAATQQKGQGASQGTSGNEVSTAAHTKPKGKGGNSTAAHHHALKQHDKAQGKAKGHSKGKAIGLNGSTPPGQAKTPPGETKNPAPSQAKTPPGQAKSPAGQANQPVTGHGQKSPASHAPKSPRGPAEVSPAHSK